MKIIYTIGIVLQLMLLVACSNDADETTGDPLFELTPTALDFQSAGGTQSAAIKGRQGDFKIAVVSPDSEWCKVTEKKGGACDSVVVTVEENEDITSRIAQISVKQGNSERMLIVRQAQKYFSTIETVKDLTAKSGAGSVILTWTEPTKANYHHSLLTCLTKTGEVVESTVINKGITSYTVKNLLSSVGEYTFEMKAFDYDDQVGGQVTVKCIAGKYVAFRFKETPQPEWVGYYFKTNDELTTNLLVGSQEYDKNAITTVKFTIDQTLIDAYNEANEEQLELFPANAYTISDLLFTGKTDYQEMSVQVNTSSLEDRHTYAIPLKIATVSTNGIDERYNTCLLIYRVDDFSGWYTVERLSKCGEDQSKYPEGKRRYIKRTGEFTWETGYLFKLYVDKETSGKTDISSDIQYITLDPKTKKIHIQQGDYKTAQDLNTFESNELHIEYLYEKWAGWWTHERMFNRSAVK